MQIFVVIEDEKGIRLELSVGDAQRLYDGLLRLFETTHQRGVPPEIVRHALATSWQRVTGSVDAVSSDSVNAEDGYGPVLFAVGRDYTRNMS